MRRITIVGAGQSGLHLALGLQAQGYTVTVVNDRTASDVRNGAVMAVQCQFGSALAQEQRHGLDFWSSVSPPLTEITYEVVDDKGDVTLGWQGRLPQSAVAIDHRVKFPTWMKLFETRGGDLRFARVTIDDLETYARESDLVLVAAGRSDLARLFTRDPDRSPFTQSQRISMLLSVNLLDERPASTAIAYRVMPGLGEFVTFPGLTTTGSCFFILLEATPGGPLDGWTELTTPDERLAQLKSLLAQWLPSQGERFAEAELTDERAVFRMRVTPTVRYPVAELPSGAKILGMGECLVQNDPLTLQGGGLATHSAMVYLDQILDRDRRPFDRAWMETTFERFWQTAQWPVRWTTQHLLPFPPHLLRFVSAAQRLPGIRQRLVNGFDNPVELYPWLDDPTATAEIIAAETLAPAGGRLAAGD